MVNKIGTTENCVQYLIEALNQGLPVLVGVDYKDTRKDNATGRVLNEGTTDHFIIIREYSHDIDGLFFRYIETAKELWSDAKWQNYILRYTDGSLSGSKFKGKQINVDYPTYTVTQYRTTIHNK